MIYFDNSATTKIDPRVVDSMLPYLKEEYGNPSVKYYKLAQSAKEAVTNARTELSSLINCDQDEIIFTSGATESNNFIIKGIADHYTDKGHHIITTKLEHKSVIDTCHYLESKGYKITYLDVDKKGRIDINKLKNEVNNKTILISIMWGNNEIGTLNNIKEIAHIAKNHNVYFHTDATQVLGKIKIDAKKIPFDFLSCSAHKIHGPKGIGATYIRSDEFGFKPNITPLLHGGKQEEKLRAGTLCVHNIVGFGKAAEIAFNEMNDYIPQINKLENMFKDKIKTILPEIKLNGDPDNKIPGILNITVPGINNEFFIKDNQDKVALSTGSACSISEPSHVLKAIGLSNSEIMSTLRVSLSKYNTESDIEDLLKILSSN